MDTKLKTIEGRIELAKLTQEKGSVFRLDAWPKNYVEDCSYLLDYISYLESVVETTEIEGE